MVHARENFEWTTEEIGENLPIADPISEMAARL